MAAASERAFSTSKQISQQAHPVLLPPVVRARPAWPRGRPHLHQQGRCRSRDKSFKSRVLPQAGEMLVRGGRARFLNPFERSSRMNRVVKLAFFSALSLLSLPAMAADGGHGVGHDRWHAEFYSKLMRPDTKTSCCNLADCRPTEMRAAGDHYEVKKDGRWIRVPP